MSCLFSVICTALLQRWILILNLVNVVNLCRSNLCEPKAQRKYFFLLLALYDAKEKPHPLDVLCLGGVANEIEGECFSNEELLKQLVLDSDWKIKTNHLDPQSSVMQGYSSRVQE